MKTIAPLNNHSNDAANPAADLVRQKLAALYVDEPDAKEEAREAETIQKTRSKHQQFMYELSQSGRSLADIQTAWHNYYIELPDADKHQVWQEFYQEHERSKTAVVPQKPATAEPKPSEQTVIPSASISKPSRSKQIARKIPRPDARTVTDIKKQLVDRISTRSRPKGGHLKSLLFGLSMGAIVVVILLFSFFNERFIAPFITPSRQVSDTQIIIDPTSTSGGSNPEIIIPKINVEIPVVYNEPSIEEHAVQDALQNGVLHYASTPNPGEVGNGTIFGHSSNNILNKGKYKFAFVLLNRLESGDTFILQKDGKRYVYRVFAKKVVKPEDVSVLDDNQGKPATFSLITCDPPGTSLNRLVVTGEQITPDPSANVASAVTGNTQKPKTLPSNAPSLWQRFTSWFTS